MQIEFCLPVHNEEKIIKKNILELFNYLESKKFNFYWKIIIIVNGSTDASLKISQELSKKYQKIKTKNIKETGKGNALKKYWLESEADILIFMDADLAVSLENIPDLITPIIEKKYDLIIGSRMLSDSKINRSILREFNSQSCSFLSRLILDLRFSDFQCGFKAIKNKGIKKINYFIEDKKWFFDTEMIVFAKKFNYRIKEIPVDWEENRYEERKSKVNLIRDGFGFFIKLLKLKKRIKTQK